MCWIRVLIGEQEASPAALSAAWQQGRATPGAAVLDAAVRGLREGTNKNSALIQLHAEVLYLQAACRGLVPAAFSSGRSQGAPDLRAACELTEGLPRGL